MQKIISVNKSNEEEEYKRKETNKVNTTTNQNLINNKGFDKEFNQQECIESIVIIDSQLDDIQQAIALQKYHDNIKGLDDEKSPFNEENSHNNKI